jgi:hypothetical protein
MRRFDVVNAAIGATFRNDFAIVWVRSDETVGVPISYGRRLLRVGDRFQDAIEHVRSKPGAIRQYFSPERGKRFGRRLKCHTHVGIDRGIAEIHTASDFHPIELSRGRVERAGRHWQTRCITEIMSRYHLQ